MRWRSLVFFIFGFVTVIYCYRLFYALPTRATVASQELMGGTLRCAPPSPCPACPEVHGRPQCPECPTASEGSLDDDRVCMKAEELDERDRRVARQSLGRINSLDMEDRKTFYMDDDDDGVENEWQQQWSDDELFHRMTDAFNQHLWHDRESSIAEQTYSRLKRRWLERRQTQQSAEEPGAGQRPVLGGEGQTTRHGHGGANSRDLYDVRNEDWWPRGGILLVLNQNRTRSVHLTASRLEALVAEEQQDRLASAVLKAAAQALGVPSVSAMFDDDGNIVSDGQIVTAAAAAAVDSRPAVRWLVVEREDEPRAPVYGAFVLLLTGSHVDWKGRDAFLCIKSLGEYNHKFGTNYPVVFFSSANAEYRAELDAAAAQVVTPVTIHWVDVSSHFVPQQFLPPPDQVPALAPYRGQVNESSWYNFQFGFDCTRGRGAWRPDYLNMIRFRVQTMWDQPILRSFDYLVQIDVDVTIYEARVDLFEYGAVFNRTFGYFKCFPDSNCAKGLYELADQWSLQQGVQWHRPHAPTEPYGPKRFQNDAYYGCLVFLRPTWFRQSPIRAWFDYIDRQGGIYLYRYSEQSIWELGISMFLPDDQLFSIGSMVSITHWGSPFGEDPQCPHIPQPDCCSGTVISPSNSNQEKFIQKYNLSDVKL